MDSQWISLVFLYFIQKAEGIILIVSKRVIKILQKMSGNSFVFDEIW